MAIFRGTGGQGDSTTDTTVTTVTQKAAEAASSATSSASSATQASNSASSASTSATNAATSETNAANSATASATSATASETAKTASEAAQTAAETAQAAAETAEANAVTAKNQAESARDNAQTAQTAAETAETNAETAETNAETAYANTLAIFGDATDVQNAVDDAEKLAVNPEDSQYTLSDTVTTGYSALHYAAKAEDSASLSQAGKDDAETASDAATASATLAATYASNASDSADEASVSASQALTYKNAAENRYDLFNDRFLGEISGDPDTDNNGDPLITGALYFNSTENEMRVYTGSAWEPVQELSGDQTVNSLTSNNDVVVKGNLEVQGTTITVDSATAQTIDLGDNDRIRLGDSDDLQVYHDGTDSYIANSTGTLKLSGNTDVTGNITVFGTVDGRDVAADGTKLDGIEASADVTDTANVTAAGALMDSEVTNLAQVKAFDSADYATAAQGATADSALQSSGDTLTGDLAFGDNVKAKFGASDDLQIYHDVSYSYVSDQGTGDLLLQGNNLRLVNYPWTKNYLTATNGGHVNLYYDGVVKLATTSSGVDVTGTVTADGLTVDGTNQIQFSNGKTAYVTGHPSPSIYRTGTSSGSEPFNLFGNLVLQSRSNAATGVYVVTGTTPATRLKIADTGDISFYDDSGTSQDFYWDASTSRLGLGTTSPSAPLEVAATATTNVDIAHFSNSNAISKAVFSLDGAGSGKFTILDAVNNEDVVLRAQGDSYFNGGNVGIGTTSPSTTLDVNGTITSTGATINGMDVGVANGATRYINTHSDAGRLSLHGGASQTGASLYLTGPSYGSGNQAEIVTSNDIRLNTPLVRFTNGSSETMRIDSSGRLGIGTTSPDTKLTLSYFANGSSEGLKLTSATRTNTEDSLSAIEVIGNSNYGTVFNVQMDGQIQISPRGSEAMRIIQNGNVGIGTTSPGDKLDISAGNINLSNGYSLAWGGSTGRPYISGDKTSQFVAVGTNGSERMRIDSSGNVGIGTTSPSSDGLEVANKAGTLAGVTELFVTGNSSGKSVLALGDGPNKYVQHIISDHTNNSLQFNTASPTLGGNEAMRIDSSGNLLVGRTANSTTDYGTTVSNDGYISTSRNGNPTAYFNRQNSDGSIAEFRKDGSTVGSIGTADGDLYVGTGDTGIKFNDFGNQIRPTNSGATKDAVIDLGADGHRFKDLYLSEGLRADTLKFSSLAGSEYGRFDSSGRLGIGTTSPTGSLHVYNATANTVGLFESGDNTATIAVRDNSSTSQFRNNDGKLSIEADVNSEAASSRIDFRVDGSEAARIDSSGNLLVGKTAVAQNNEGVELRSTGLAIFTKADSNAIKINRTGSDGDLAIFSKGGNNVGSIGTISDDLYIHSTATDHRGLRFGQGFVSPITATATTSDGGCDLGESSARFKNLFLSGGVYLGGTGSANLLDDYEEGTFNPDISGGVYGDGEETGVYVKIGSLVHVTISIYRPSDITSSTSIGLTLPFTVLNGYTANFSCYSRLITFPSGTTNILAAVTSNTTNLNLRKIESDANFGILTHAAFSSSYARLQITGTYRTSA